MLQLRLKILRSKNILLLLASKFMTSYTDSLVKNKSKPALKHLELAESIEEVILTINDLDEKLSMEAKINSSLLITVASQEKEIKHLKDKITRYEQHIQNKGL